MTQDLIELVGRAAVLVGALVALLAYLRSGFRDRVAVRQARLAKFEETLESKGKAAGLARQIHTTLACQRELPLPPAAVREAGDIAHETEQLEGLVIEWASLVEPDDRERARRLGLIKGAVAQLQVLRARAESLVARADR